MIRAIEWKNDHISIIDQTKLPFETIYIDLITIEDVFDAIQKLKIRGAPAIGIAAAYGLYLAFKNIKNISISELFNLLDEKIDYLSSARPTAVNLKWALQNIKEKIEKEPDVDVDSIKKSLLRIEIHEDDRSRCDSISNYGQGILGQNCRVLTHCNTGALATGGTGTALGVITKAYESGKILEVFATESRPILQGARLTVWELKNYNIPVTLVCDSMAAWLMNQKKADVVIVGADRIASDGSTANKIGTYNLAILAKYHQIPFYIAAPLSTFDVAINNGKEIPIEYRHADEIRKILNKFDITLPDVKCWNPAFDITPPDLIDGIITEEGIIRPPYKLNINKILTTSVTT
jgi:methylthioribose-1-phosphate isomerase